MTGPVCGWLGSLFSTLLSPAWDKQDVVTAQSNVTHWPLAYVMIILCVHSSSRCSGLSSRTFLVDFPIYICTTSWECHELLCCSKQREHLTWQHAICRVYSYQGKWLCLGPKQETSYEGTTQLKRWSDIVSKRSYQSRCLVPLWWLMPITTGPNKNYVKQFPFVL